jgi:GntR family galactonate operon transcriptional repressor
MLALMEAAVEDSDAYLEPDLRFHAIILEGCHNELLEQMGKVLRGVFRALFVRVSEARETRVRALPLHAAIVEAIRAHDPEAAELATRVLIDDTAASLNPSRDGALSRTR